MIRLSIFFTVLCLFSSALWAETAITGKTINPKGEPVGGILIRLYERERLKTFSTSKKDGTFLLKADSMAFPVMIKFISQSYEKKEIQLNAFNEPMLVTLAPKDYVLDEVVVKVPRVRMKGDTITYDVASYTSKADRSIEDIIRKLPGIQISDDGTISYDGEPINNFYIEGLDLMGASYPEASRNISPSDIATVSIYERHQPKKVLKNFVDSKNAALNLKLKNNRLLKPVGHLRGGTGGGENALWDADFYGMLISPENQTIVTAKSNNAGSIYYKDNAGSLPQYNVLDQRPFGSPSIPDSRFLDNQSHEVSANTLVRLKKDFNLTFNASYNFERNNYSGVSSTEYLASGSGMDNISYSESADNTLCNKMIAASLKAEKNSERLYFSDVVSFSGKFNNNDYLFDNGEDIRQTIDNKSFSIANDLNLIARNDNKTFEISSHTFFNTTPENSLCAYDSDTALPFLKQLVNGKTFANSESTGFTWQFGKFSSLGTNLGFFFNHDSFESILIPNDPVNSNDISGYRISGVVTPFYNFIYSGRFSWKTSVPLTGLHLKYTDVSKYSDVSPGEPSLTTRFYPDLNSDIFYKINSSNDIGISLGWQHTTGKITDFITSPIHTSFRNTTTLGNATLEKGRRDYVSAKFSHRDILNAFYFRGSVSFSKYESNTLAASDVNQNGTSLSDINEKNHVNTTNLLVYSSKEIRNWHTIFSFDGNVILSSRKRSRAGNILDVRSLIYIIAGKVETSQFNDRLSARLSLTYSHNRHTIRHIESDTDLNDLTINTKLAFFPIGRLEFYSKLFLNYTKTGADNHSTNLFIDAGIRYPLKKWELELKANNLANSKEYRYRIYRSLDVSTYSYRLRPTEVIFSIRYNI